MGEAVLATVEASSFPAFLAPNAVTTASQQLVTSTLTAHAETGPPGKRPLIRSLRNCHLAATLQEAVGMLSRGLPGLLSQPPSPLCLVEATGLEESLGKRTQGFDCSSPVYEFAQPHLFVPAVTHEVSLSLACSSRTALQLPQALP